jgi:hypothetical protein
VVSNSPAKNLFYTLLDCEVIISRASLQDCGTVTPAGMMEPGAWILDLDRLHCMEEHTGSVRLGYSSLPDRATVECEVLILVVVAATPHAKLLECGATTVPRHPCHYYC